MKLLLLCVVSVCVLAYDQNRLAMHAKVFEKILLLDADLAQKVSQSAQLPIILFYDETEELDAVRMKRHMEEAAQESAFPYTLDIRLQRFADFSAEPAAAYYLLESSSNQVVRNIAESAAERGILSFSYNYAYLAEGVMLSLGLDKKVYPILNPEAVKKSKINFNPILIRIAKKYQP